MRRHFDVSRLTRPCQIRCRPILFIRPNSTAPNQADSATKPVKSSPSRSTKSGKAVSPAARKEEQRDYLQAMELQKGKKPPSQAPTPRTLPTLRNPQSFDHSPEKRFSANSSANTADSKGKGKAPEVPRKRRRNPVGVQLLSPSLHRQIFPGPSLPKPRTALVNLSTTHLRTNGLQPKDAAVLNEINFGLPPLRGSNIRDHFWALGQQVAEPYLSMAKRLADTELPDIPESWVLDRPGWTRYGRDGSVSAVEDLGDEQLVTFDVEVLYKISPYPVMATAATPNAWYSWLCPTIFENSPSHIPPPKPRWDPDQHSHLPHDLIPLFKGSDLRVVIGHNVGYDRARVKEEYQLERTSTRFIDTLSLHVATRGITSVQRPEWMQYRKKKQNEDLVRQAMEEVLGEDEADPENLPGSSSVDGEDTTWEGITSINSLAEVAKLHCGYKVDKTARERFGDEDLKHASQLRPELDELLSYCAQDVKVTHDVYTKVFPLFLESCPHPVTFAGVLNMGDSFLPVNETWSKYLENTETMYQEMVDNVQKCLRVLADKLRKQGPREGDPWYSQLDWSPKAARWPEGTEAISSTTTSIMSTASKTPASASTSSQSSVTENEADSRPAWIITLEKLESADLKKASSQKLIPLTLRISYKGFPVAYLSKEYWCFKVPHESLSEHIDAHGAPVELSDRDEHLEPCLDNSAFLRISAPGASRKSKLTGNGIKKLVRDGELTSPYPDLLGKFVTSGPSEDKHSLLECAKDLEKLGPDNAWGMQLDWKPASQNTAVASKTRTHRTNPVHGTWPKWYWELSKSANRLPPGELDLTQKKRVTPLLLRLQWQGWPLFYSKYHKWLYRVPKQVVDEEVTAELDGSKFGESVIWDDGHEHDQALQEDDQHYYFRLPHSDGEGKNVGSPLSKPFVKALESGELSSVVSADKDDATAKAATEATQMNVLGSYWTSARERIMSQMVVYDSPKSGMILPQVVTMGTVTRRAVESTWLTASNAKKNRVGSELKAMVRAPPGYALVGADVDSEELWISSVMGDSQFGMHGATAIGWMTLEGTKAAGTDLHSKTAAILGTSRDAAKVFNYSRIYGAGQKHAVQLLLQGDPSLGKAKATETAKDLYNATKGSKISRSSYLDASQVPSLWYGGSESFLFNTLEMIALSNRPTTPALGCGVTKALTKSYLSTSNTYLPSRINWVVQSSGVDYLHLLIVSMDYLIKRYDIRARYLISVHDEVRYLAKEEDQYRTALALQIANAWTRALFCFNLGFDDVPQGVTFFSAVDIDHVLRKEVLMPCVTPSHPEPISPGESLDIEQILEKTNGGVLGMPVGEDAPFLDTKTTPPVVLFPNIDSTEHFALLRGQTQRDKGLAASTWLDAQPPVLDEEGNPIRIEPKRSRKSDQAKWKSAQRQTMTDHLSRRGGSMVDWDEVAWDEKNNTREDPLIKRGKTLPRPLSV